ncbi:MAG: LysR family transcriptional regulator [Hyphomicrobiaceae bacterium]|nr:LysR family transcriptional regulator [Hyphomicrobiaceae bacterium]
MDLKQLEYFVQVAEHSSFSKAASVLDVAQPALSRQIRRLEMELKEFLFIRSGRGVVLTDAGRRLFEHSIAILQLADRARADLVAVHDAPVGRVVVGLPPSITRLLTVPLVEHFKSQLPDCRLAIVEGLSSHVVEWVTSGRVDVGLAYNPDAQAGVEIAPLRREPLGLVMPKARGGKEPAGSVPFSELPKYPLIVPERMHAMRRLLENQAAHAGVRLDIAWEVSSVPSIVELVLAGYGYAVLTASGVAASAGAGRLMLRELVAPRTTSVLCTVHSALKRPTPLSQHVMRFIRSVMDNMSKAKS